MSGYGRRVWSICLRRHVSFVDCPGHDILMATMLNGAAVMDAALLLIAANEPCPQPQTSEHLAAVEIMKLTQLLILQNKIDLVREAQGREQYKDIVKFIEGAMLTSLHYTFYIDYSIDLLIAHYQPRIFPLSTRFPILL